MVKKQKLMSPLDLLGMGWSTERVEYGEALYKKRLFLVRKYEGESMPPTYDIDVVWHFHILDTVAYRRDTEMIFGYYLHHVPYFGMRGLQDERDWSKASANIHSRCHQEFGHEVYEFDPDYIEEPLL